ncbi:xylanase [Panaeolus papilionaceus]|nr:xylanase [Panaeolus papilionaceus]
MLNWKAPLAFIAAIVSACVASPTIPRLVTRAGTPNSAGFHDGVFYSWWSDGAGNATYTNGPGGSYSVNWTDSQGNFFGGKGWNSASNNRVAKYEGTFNPTGNGYFGLYGWNKDPMTEYHVLESYGTYNPATSSPLKGKVVCNGATYDIILTIRYPIGFSPTIYQYWSIRNPKLPNGKIGGTIDFGCHVAAWEGLGMKLGNTPDFQIMATEGYMSTGSSNITIS